MGKEREREREKLYKLCTWRAASRHVYIRVYTHVHDALAERERSLSSGETHTYPAKFTIDLSRRDQLVIKLDAEQPSVTAR